MSTYITDAIILSVNDFRENDKKIVLYSREFGKVEAKLIGAKKIQSKLSSAVEQFSCADFTLAHGRLLDTIIGAVPKQDFMHLRDNFTGFVLGNILIETLLRSTYEHQAESKKIFNLSLEVLSKLDENIADLSREKLIFIVKSFTLRLLGLCGHSPELGKCTVCGKKLNNSSDSYLKVKFSPKFGGIVCLECSKKQINIGRNTVKMYEIDNSMLDVMKNSIIGVQKFDSNNLSKISRITTDFLYHVIEKPLKSDRFLYYI